MALRCLLFSSDEGSAEPICQVLAGLGVEGESCSEAVTAVERVTSQSFQIVIIDWDKQPEATFLLKTARERKASERPLTLAIVSDDASVPTALQAGANSILRKPIFLNQVKDTLTTARDLLRAKQESAATAAQAAAAGAGSSASATPARVEPGGDNHLRAGEFLQSSGPNPGTQFDTESEMQKSLEQSEVGVVDPLKELEPMAASVAEAKPAPAPLPSSNEPRGLQWYLNARAGTLPAPASTATAAAPAPEKPELLGWEHSPSVSETAPAETSRSSTPAVPSGPTPEEHEQHEQKTEAALFAYIAGEGKESQQDSKPRFHLGKGPILAALALATCAVVAAPQAPWHANVLKAYGRIQQKTHSWLNPQPVTTAPAPRAHEDFGRAGDEYKLPVAETIPDATTDPNQIRVVPVVDPTIKPPTNPAGSNAGQIAGQPNVPNPTDPTQAPATQVQESPPPQSTPAMSQPAGETPADGTSAAPSSTTTTAAAPAEQPHSDAPIPAASEPPVTPPPPPKPQPRTVSAPANTSIPSSLKSQMASMTPDASGNKPPEAALPSIEPVNLPEATERALMIEQPAIIYPANAKGQQGTVVLQVLIGRDGTVQDAKFLQGSLAFARTAIDGVKLWKFKPYLMNGRPASVQTVLTMSFKP